MNSLLSQFGFLENYFIDKNGLNIEKLKTPYQQVINVAKEGAEFSVIQDAIDSVQDNSALKAYAIIISPGIYEENLVLKPYVTLSPNASLPSGVIITSTSGTLMTFPDSGQTEIDFLTLKMETTVSGSKLFNVPGGYNLITDCLIYLDTIEDVSVRIGEFTGGTLLFGRSSIYPSLLGTSETKKLIELFRITNDATLLFNVCEIIGTINDVNDDITLFSDDSSGTIIIGASFLNLYLTNENYNGIVKAYCGTKKSDTLKSLLISEINLFGFSGQGTAICLGENTDGENGILFSHHSQYTATGFENNYSACIGAGDIVYTIFDAFFCEDGYLGDGYFLGNYSDYYGNFVALGRIVAQGGALDFLELSENPASLAGFGSVFTKDSTHDLYFMDSLGFVQRIGGMESFKAFPFSSPNGTTGIFYSAGGYYASGTDANLTQASATINWGTANIAYGARVFLVAGGAGSASGGSGLVRIKVSGTSITDAGVRTASDSEVIVADIKQMTLNAFYQTTKKWIGLITFTLENTPGATQTNFSADFNYGFVKMENYGGKDFKVTYLDIEGLAGANDSWFDIELIHHKASGFVYATTGFVPTSETICKLSTDYVTERNLANGQQFAYKRNNLDETIYGSLGEGLIIKVTIGANGSVQRMGSTIGVFII